MHLAARRILEECVDGEVAPGSVVLEGPEAHGAGPATVDVRVVGAERRHLEAAAVLEHEDDAELHAHRHGAAEETPNRLGRRAGGDVVVERLPPEQAIADAAAREEGFVPGRAQAADHVSRQPPPLRHVGR